MGYDRGRRGRGRDKRDGFGEEGFDPFAEGGAPRFGGDQLIDPLMKRRAGILRHERRRRHPEDQQTGKPPHEEPSTEIK